MSRYCVAKIPTPILNCSDFKKVFGTPLPLDNRGLLRPIEMVALPGTKFQIHRQVDSNILEISTRDYPLGNFYIDQRFTTPCNFETPERNLQLPSKQKILSQLTASLGLPYVWGGNWRKGIRQILKYYPTNAQETQWIHTLSGVDCSGLLYEASSGFTPRNTSQLFTFGEEVLSISNVKPLDILVWKYHVVIVLDHKTTIESLFGKGVILSNLDERIKKLSHTDFVIRRYIQ